MPWRGGPQVGEGQAVHRRTHVQYGSNLRTVPLAWGLQIVRRCRRRCLWRQQPESHSAAAFVATVIWHVSLAYSRECRSVGAGTGPFIYICTRRHQRRLHVRHVASSVVARRGDASQAAVLASAPSCPQVRRDI